MSETSQNQTDSATTEPVAPATAEALVLNEEDKEYAITVAMKQVGLDRMAARKFLADLGLPKIRQVVELGRAGKLIALRELLGGNEASE